MEDHGELQESVLSTPMPVFATVTATKPVAPAMTEEEDDIYTASCTRLTQAVPIGLAWNLLVLTVFLYNGVFQEEYMRYGPGISKETYERHFGSTRARLDEDCMLFRTSDPLAPADGAAACEELHRVRLETLDDSTAVMYLGFYIDSRGRYLSLMAFAVLSAMFSSFMWSIPATYMSNVVQDPNVRILPFSYREIQSCGAGLRIYLQLSTVLELGVCFVQGDFCLAVITGQILFGIWFTNRFMQARSHEREVDRRLDLLLRQNQVQDARLDMLATSSDDTSLRKLRRLTMLEDPGRPPLSSATHKAGFRFQVRPGGGTGGRRF